MTNYYAIRNDGYTYRELDYTTVDVVNNAPKNIEPEKIVSFSKHNLKMSPWWVTPEAAYIENEGVGETQMPDINLWTGGAECCLVLSPKAFRLLGESLHEYGEFLPVKISGETYVIFNCLIFGGTDEDETEYEYIGETKIGLNKIVFNDKTTDLFAFKIHEDNATTLYCNDRLKSAVEGFELKGLIFDENLVEQFD